MDAFVKVLGVLQRIQKNSAQNQESLKWRIGPPMMLIQGAGPLHCLAPRAKPFIMCSEGFMIACYGFGMLTFWLMWVVDVRMLWRRAGKVFSGMEDTESLSMDLC